ncbi:MAG: hypothetical protein EP329_14010 [Deltaproteobacteria bacterium]|nr:MAG: hypothetical protein EP329_14010 [Deltaproteobacteria bacterium]
MGVVADLLLVLLTVVGVLVLLVLVMPITLRARGVAEGTDVALEVRGSWAFGALSVRWRMSDGAALHLFGLRVHRIRPDSPEERAEKRRKRAEKKARKAERARLKKKKKKRGPGWTWRHRRTLWRAVLRVVRTLHIDGRVAGVVGMADPDHTAWLGVALDELAARLPDGALAVEVDYMDEVLAVGGHLQSRVWPIEVLVVLTAVRFGGEMRRALRAA